MSLSLGVLIKELFPNYSINLIERLNDVSLESSGGFNNAGTGHAGYCELNYTPENKYGQVDITRAIKINEMFENSLEFWAYLEKKYSTFNCSKFLRKTPHISFVKGDKNINFLKKRFDLLKKQPLFEKIEFTTDPKVIQKWAPLIFSNKISITKNGIINIEIKNLINKTSLQIRSNKIFIGAGGQSIPLLQKIGLKEANGYAGFPLSGKWLICDNDK